MKRSCFLVVLCLLLPGLAQAWDTAHADQRAAYQTAKRNLAAGHGAAAAESLRELAEGNWPAADVAAARLCDMAEKADRKEEARQWNRFLVSRFPYSRYRPDAIVALAEALVAEPNGASEAAKLANTLLRDHPGKADAQAHYLLGEALLATGRAQEAAAAYAEAAYFHRGDYSDKAFKRLGELKKTGMKLPKPDAKRLWDRISENIARRYYWTANLYADRYARVFAGTEKGFRARLVSADMLIARRKHKEAKKALQTLARQASSADRKAAVAIRLKRYNTKNGVEQKRLYFTKIAGKPGSWGSRVDARLALLQLEMDAERFGNAARWGARLVDDDAASLFLPEETLWQTAFAYYLAGDFQNAAVRLNQWLKRYPKHGDHDRASYWLGRTYERLGDKKNAVHVFHVCYDRWQGTYYGLAAEARLLALGIGSDQLPRLPFTGEAKQVVARATALLELQREWEQNQGGGETRDAGATQALDYVAAGDSRFAPVFREVRELFAMGEDAEAKALLDLWRDDMYEDATSPYFLSVAYGLAGDNLASIRASYRGFEMVRDNRLADPHALLSRRRFPLLQEALIAKTAKQHKLDKYLVFGIIKQESAFQTRATSWAGARGLMQVMPGTGQYIAKRRGMKNFNTKKLYKPEVSVDFGCWLMAHLLQKRFDGDLPAALAGYNAGWGRPPRWWAPNVGRTYDELIERIPFDETRGYVKGIVRNYEMYLRLYKDPGATGKRRPSVLNLLNQKAKGLP